MVTPGSLPAANRSLTASYGNNEKTSLQHLKKGNMEASLTRPHFNPGNGKHSGSFLNQT